MKPRLSAADLQTARDAEYATAYRDWLATLPPEELARLVEAAEEFYSRKPGTVRKIIVSGSHSGLATFADAFRLWKD